MQIIYLIQDNKSFHSIADVLLDFIFGTAAITKSWIYLKNKALYINLLERIQQNAQTSKMLLLFVTWVSGNKKNI